MSKLELPVLGAAGSTRDSAGESLAEELLKADLKLAARCAKLKKKQDVLRQIKEHPPELPAGKYSVIVLDPPWQYDTKVEDGGTVRGLVDYPTMTLTEIAELPVPELAHQSCMLWLWATNSFLGAAWELAVGWGFSVKTVLTWDKVHHGVGFYLLNVTEHCLVGVRGSPVVDLQGAYARFDEGLCCAPNTMLRCPREEHSRKPRLFYRLVEYLCPCGPEARLEMFAREPREGWVSWGAETAKFGVSP